MSVASAVYERTCHVCDAVKYYVMKSFINMQRGRQLSANNKIMHELRWEYPHNSDLRYHINEINDRTNQEYDKKIADLKSKSWPWEVRDEW